MTELAFVHNTFQASFEKTFFWKLMDFLNKPEALEIVKFDPKQNPTSYCFVLKKLQQMCPDFAVHNQRIRVNLMKFGFNITNNQALWIVSHPDITIRSSKEQMMQVWFKATLSEFKRIEKLIPRIYRSLQNKDLIDLIYWLPDEKRFFVKEQFAHEFTLYTLKTWGFQVLKPAKQYMILWHPLLNQKSSIVMWLAVTIKYDRTTNSLTLADPIQDETFKFTDIFNINPTSIKSRLNLENSNEPRVVAQSQQPYLKEQISESLGNKQHPQKSAPQLNHEIEHIKIEACETNYIKSSSTHHTEQVKEANTQDPQKQIVISKPDPEEQLNDAIRRLRTCLKTIINEFPNLVTNMVSIIDFCTETGEAFIQRQISYRKK